MTPILADHVDVLITSIEDMALSMGWTVASTAPSRSWMVISAI